MRLGHIGDQVFALAITDLIQELHPHLRVGPASVRQSAVIRNGSHITHILAIQKVRDHIKRKSVIAEM